MNRTKVRDYFFGDAFERRPPPPDCEVIAARDGKALQPLVASYKATCFSGRRCAVFKLGQTPP